MNPLHDILTAALNYDVLKIQSDLQSLDETFLISLDDALALIKAELNIELEGRRNA